MSDTTDIISATIDVITYLLCLVTGVVFMFTQEAHWFRASVMFGLWAITGTLMRYTDNGLAEA